MTIYAIEFEFVVNAMTPEEATNTILIKVVDSDEKAIKFCENHGTYKYANHYHANNPDEFFEEFSIMYPDTEAELVITSMEVE